MKLQTIQENIAGRKDTFNIAEGRAPRPAAYLSNAVVGISKRAFLQYEILAENTKYKIQQKVEKEKEEKVNMSNKSIRHAYSTAIHFYACIYVRQYNTFYVK